MPFPGYIDTSAKNVADSKRPFGGLSSALWKHVNESAIANNPGNNYARMFSGADLADWIDLTTTANNDYAIGTEATTGATVITNGVAGATGPVLAIDSEAGGDGQGMEIQFSKMGVTPTDGWSIYFEARIALSDISSGVPDSFAGLASIDTTVMTTAGLPTAANSAGFYTSAAASLNFAVTTGTPSAVDTGHDMVDLDQADAVAQVPSAWTKVGFRLDGTADGGDYYVNGVKGAESVTWSLGPDAVIVPSFSCLGSAAVDVLMFINWFKVAQVEV